MVKNKKIIIEEDRIILIKNELTNVDDWTKLINTLTFQEGMAMMTAASTFANEFMPKPQVSNDKHDYEVK